MDMPSWLRRRKSSEKIVVETGESGSISSQPEKISDDQAFYTCSSQSPEVISKVVASDEDVNDLKERLSAAIQNIRLKEESVKQHSKVAEEALSGWEKAESEVLSVKKQLDAAVQKNSVLGDRVDHLDGALKECIRQLRKSRDEQDQKIKEAVNLKIHEWESKKFELESQNSELKAQLQDVPSNSAVSLNQEVLSKLESLEEENIALNRELISRAEEVEVRILERDLSTQAAETASKINLESIKKLIKLESECNRLNAIVRKTFPKNDPKNYTPSSIYVESFTDSMSDTGERVLAVENDMHKINGSNIYEPEPSHSDTCPSSVITELDHYKYGSFTGKIIMVPSVEINLMDDFLEIERLAALPDTEVRSSCLEARTLPDTEVRRSCIQAETVSDRPSGSESVLRDDFDALIHRTSELEERLEMVEAQKLQLEIDLSKSDKQIQTLRKQLKEGDEKLLELQKMEERELELEMALAGSQKQHESLMNKLKKTEAKLLELGNIKDEKLNLETALTGSQKQLEALMNKLNKTEVKVLKLETLKAEKLELEMTFTKTQKQADKSQNQLKDTERRLIKLQKELAHVTNGKEALEELVKVENVNKEVLKLQLKNNEDEIKPLLLRVASLEEDVKRERSLSAKQLIKCQELQDQILRLQSEPGIQGMLNYKAEMKKNQEKELVVSAIKFAECQKTIASLGQQLKSFATMEDFLNGSDEPIELNDETLPCSADGEPCKLHLVDSNVPQ